MKSPIQQDTRIAAFAERKMRSWGQVQETAAHAACRLERPVDGAGGKLCRDFPRGRGGGAAVARSGGRAPWLEGV